MDMEQTRNLGVYPMTLTCDIESMWLGNVLCTPHRLTKRNIFRVKFNENRSVQEFRRYGAGKSHDLKV